MPPEDKEPKKRIYKRKDGYSRIVQNPKSPFQVMISNAMARKQLSYRTAAEEIDVKYSTLYAWVHNETGYPAATVFDPEIHIPLMSKAFDLPIDEIKAAIDHSRLQFHNNVEEAERPSTDAFKDFIEFLQNWPQKSIKIDRALKIATRLYNGASNES